MKFSPSLLTLLALAACTFRATAQDEESAKKKPETTITKTLLDVRIETPELQAAVRKRGYVTGIAGGSFVDRKTGFKDLGFGLDIIDWLMEPGSDEAYRDQLAGDLPYKFGDRLHGKTAKRSVEGPQICTQARELDPEVVKGKDFVGVRMSWSYKTAAPGRATGSTWRQTIVFPAGKRYFISSDRITSANTVDELFFRQDMPGHIKHTRGTNFSEVWLSYLGKIPSSEFLTDFAPDEKFNYRRDVNGVPKRMIRAYHIRDPRTGADGPWLAGMTLNPADVYEAWCHQRSYVCFIQEIGGRPIKAGETFGAAYIVGFFDSIEEMERVYDEHAGHSSLSFTEDAWKLE